MSECLNYIPSKFGVFERCRICFSRKRKHANAELDIQNEGPSSKRISITVPCAPPRLSNKHEPKNVKRLSKPVKIQSSKPTTVKSSKSRTSLTITTVSASVPLTKCPLKILNEVPIVHIERSVITISTPTKSDSKSNLSKSIPKPPSPISLEKPLTLTNLMNAFEIESGKPCPYQCLEGDSSNPQIFSFGSFVYHKGRQLGKGREGTVYSAECVSLDQIKMNPQQKDHFKTIAMKVRENKVGYSSERKILNILATSNKPPLHSQLLYDCDDKMILFMECIDGKTLQEIFLTTMSMKSMEDAQRCRHPDFQWTFWSKKNPNHIDMNKVRVVSLSLAQAIDGLSNHKIRNLDQHIGNIMVNDKFQCYLIDLAMASHHPSSQAWVGYQTCCVAFMQGQVGAKGLFRQLKELLAISAGVDNTKCNLSEIINWVDKILSEQDNFKLHENAYQTIQLWFNQI